MDADGSHPPETIPSLVDPVRFGQAELVLASRHLPGASSPGLGGFRRLISTGAALLARPLTPVSDPMSGFFALKRCVAERARLEPTGFKIGLEILVRCRPSPVLEVPFRFGSRLAGSSKLGSGQIVRYLRHLSRLYLWEAEHYRSTHARRPAPSAVAGSLFLAAPAFVSAHPAAEGVEDRAEPGYGEPGRAGFAYDQAFAEEVEAEPGEAGGDGEGDETSREEPEGAFPTAAPRPVGVETYAYAEGDHGTPEYQHPRYLR